MPGMRGRAFVLVIVLMIALSGCSSLPAGLFNSPLGPDNRPHVSMHYLGNGGWIFQRGDDLIATAPFVSQPRWYTFLTPGHPDKRLIDEVIPDMGRVGIILVGHAHYDHAMDLPYIATQKAPNAQIYGGPTVVNTLGAVDALKTRLHLIDPATAAHGDTSGPWLPSATAPIRFMPLRSTHAPHFAGLKFLPTGHVHERQDKLPCCPFWWKEGETLAFVIDFLDERRQNVEFRIYFQDAASRPGTGIMPVLTGRDAARVDVAILCVAGFDQFVGNPQHILANVQPRHVVGGHWEDFFARSFKERPLRPAFGTSLESFHRRARKVTSVPIYLPESGQTLYFPIGPKD
jgi:L-ascorbate metabolism protein UlaG (beta-lactamase superfamily)